MLLGFPPLIGGLGLLTVLLLGFPPLIGGLPLLNARSTPAAFLPPARSIFSLPALLFLPADAFFLIAILFLPWVCLL
jgi:hypothetical protein